MAVGGNVPGMSWAGGAADPAVGGARGAMPVCDPQMLPSFRRWAHGQRPAFNSRGELAVLTPGGSSGGVRPAAICCWLLAVACMILLVADPLSIGRGGWVAAAAVTATAAATIQHRSSRRDLRLCRSKVIFPESLDATCLALLRRGQRAISTILDSQVRAAGLLGNPVDDTMLRQHEWEIASQLREITTLRALLTQNTPGAPAGPMTTDVLNGQQRALELAHEATTARILALEKYASHVTAADDADRDWQQATCLSKLNDKYLDLVARTASDDYATDQIAGLTEELSATARERNDRLHDADLAARVLILPTAASTSRHP